MKKDDLRALIEACCNDVTFFYNGKASGVTSEVENYAPMFQAWHGDDTKTYTSVDDVMRDKFYSGKSLNDLVDVVSINIA